MCMCHLHLLRDMSKFCLHSFHVCYQQELKYHQFELQNIKWNTPQIQSGMKICLWSMVLPYWALDILDAILTCM